MAEEYFDDVDEWINKVNNDEAKGEQEQEQHEPNVHEIGNGNGKGNTNQHQYEQEQQENKPTQEQLNEILAPKIPDRDYAEYVIASISKTVKQEDSLVRQLFYTALSKDSASPQNLAVLAPTSEGKTHPVQEMLRYFPEQDIWVIGSMSPKVIIRQNGVLVDKNNKPLDPQIAGIKSEIRYLKRELDKSSDSIERSDIENEIEQLKEKIAQLHQDAKVLIELTGKLFVFLEPPHPETWNILKPILSHDKFEIEHPYVYQDEGKGFKVKKIVTRGWPACIFCSAKNESKWPEWPEVQSRFLITSPNMIKKKYSEGIKLSAQRKGLPKLAQQYVIISDTQVEIAKKCVLYLTEQMQGYLHNKENPCPVWNPYYDILSDAVPSEKGTDNRVANRILDFVNIVALSHGHLRQELQYGKERLVTADIKKDLPEVIKITQNITGLPTFKVDFFRKFVIGAYKQKIAKEVAAAVASTTGNNNKTLDGDGGEDRQTKHSEDEIIGVTSRDIVDYYRSKSGKTTKSINTNNLKETYLDDYVNVGWLDYKEPEKHRQSYVYYPIIELQEQEEDEQQQQNLSSQSSMTPLDKNLTQPRLLMHKNFKEIQKDWLELEILRLISYPVMLDTFELYNSNKEKTCICQFVKEYNTNVDINGYFSKPDFHKNYNKIFDSIKFVGEINQNHDKNLSSHPIIDLLDYKTGFIYSGTKNAIYQRQILQKVIEQSTKEQEESSTTKAKETGDYWTKGAWTRNLPNG